MPGELFETLRQLSANNPFLKFMGMELLDAGEGWVKMKIAFRPEFLQPLTVHGGATYSLAVRDQDLYCEARIVHLGKTLAYAEATITAEDGTLVAKSAATLMRLDRVRK